MAIFLLLAASSFVLIVLLISVESVTRGNRRLFRWRKWIHIAANRWLIESFAIAGLVLLVSVVLFFTFSQITRPTSSIYGWFDFLTSRTFSQAILGTIFGVLFAVWIVRVYRASAAQSEQFSLAQKIEGVALLLLFIIGTTSTPLEELIRSVRLKAPGFEFSAGGSSQGNLAAQTSDPQAAGSLQLSSNPNSSTGQALEEFDPRSGMGLGTIQSLSGLIQRDADYLETYAAKQPSDAESDSQTQQDHDTQSNQKKRDAAHLIERLKDAAKGYDAAFNSLGRCLAGLASITGDVSYVERNLAELRPLVRELYAQMLAIRSGEAENFDSVTLEALQNKVEIIGVDARAHAERLRSGYSLKLVARAARSEAQRVFDSCEKLNHSVQAAAMDHWVAERPYLAILYAAFLQLENQELAAIDALRMWRIVKEEESNAATAKNDGSEWQTWFELRIRATEVWLFETFRRRAPQLAQAYTNSYLRSLEQYLALLQDLSAVKDHHSEIFPALGSTSDTTIMNLGLGQTGTYGLKCSYSVADAASTSAFLTDMLLNRAYLSGKSVYVRRALDRVAYSERIHRLAKSYAEDIVTADYACLRVFYQRYGSGDAAREVDRMKAEGLRVYALLQLSELERKKPIGTNYRSWAIERVRLASEAFTAARAMIEKYHEPDRPHEDSELLTAASQKSLLERLWDDLEARIEHTANLAQQLGAS